jgi:hypothetical protein
MKSFQDRKSGFLSWGNVPQSRKFNFPVEIVFSSKWKPYFLTRKISFRVRNRWFLERMDFMIHDQFTVTAIPFPITVITVLSFQVVPPSVEV